MAKRLGAIDPRSGGWRFDACQLISRRRRQCGRGRCRMSNAFGIDLRTMENLAPPPPELFARQSRPVQWLILLAISLLLAAVLELAQLPAALLVGPMLAAIFCGVNGATVRPNRSAFMAAQAIVGCLIASSIAPEIFSSFLAEWPLFLGIVVSTLVAQQLPRLPDQPLEGAAGHHRRLGLDARGGERHGADGRCLRRRRAPRRLHAISARHLRLDRRGGDRAALGRHVGRRRAGDGLVPADRRGRPLPQRSPSPRSAPRSGA